MKDPFFSVIIPVYKRKDLVVDAIESVLRQTYDGFEIIVADDGSFDGTAEIVESLIGSRASGSLLRLDHSGFPGAVRNRAAEVAKGTWLAFLDSDDLWMPEKLEKQGDYILTHPECRLLHTRERWLRNGKEISQKKLKHKREGDIFSDALVKCIIGPSTAVVKTKLYQEKGGFREDLEIAEDYELWLRLLNEVEAGYIDIPLIEKRAGLPDQEQLSEKYGQIEIFRIEALESLIKNKYFTPEKQRIAQKELIRKLEIYANGCRKRGKEAEASEFEIRLESYLGAAR